MKTGLPNMILASRRIGTLPARTPRKSWMSAPTQALFVRRERWTLTWTGRLLILAFLAVVIVVLGGGSAAFWRSPALPVDRSWWSKAGCRPTLIVKPRPVSQGRLQERSFALDRQARRRCELELRERSGGEKLIYFGLPSELVVTVSSGEVHRDRTFHSATAVKDWLREQGLQTASIDVVTVGPHARRSRLLYEKAFGDDVRSVSFPSRIGGLTQSLVAVKRGCSQSYRRTDRISVCKDSVLQFP
jgi:hypothetical protein